MLDIFTPYLIFLTFLLAIIINVILLKFRVNIWGILIANVILTLVLNFIGLKPYDFISQIVTQLIDILVDIVKAIWDYINPFNWFIITK